MLIGDAAGPFPPIGQGVNAAMESAGVLTDSIGRVGSGPELLPATAAAYGAAWQPEVEAISWISERMLFENRLHTLRATSRCGWGSM